MYYINKNSRHILKFSRIFQIYTKKQQNQIIKFTKTDQINIFKIPKVKLQNITRGFFSEWIHSLTGKPNQ